MDCYFLHLLCAQIAAKAEQARREREALKVQRQEEKVRWAAWRASLLAQRRLSDYLKQRLRAERGMTMGEILAREHNKCAAHSVQESHTQPVHQRAAQLIICTLIEPAHGVWNPVWHKKASYLAALEAC
eukprot:6468436-Amphidinium_carterae.2